MPRFTAATALALMYPRWLLRQRVIKGKLKKTVLITAATLSGFLVGGGWHWFVDDGFINKIIYRTGYPVCDVDTWHMLFFACGPALSLVCLTWSVGVCVLPMVKDPGVRGPLKLSLFGLSSAIVGTTALVLTRGLGSQFHFASCFGMVLACIMATLSVLSVLTIISGAGVVSIGFCWYLAELISGCKKPARLPWIP